MNPTDSLTRRGFIATASAAGVAALPAVALPKAQAAQTNPAAAPRQPAAPPATVKLPPLSAPSEQQSPPTPNPLPPAQRVGYAIVGLGHLSLDQILPAFALCKKSRPVALVSGDRAKALAVGAQYGLSPANVYDYASYDRLRDNPAVEVIYIVLPNGQHEEFTVRGAKAGKHILCEKPMANDSAQARRMIAACAAANRKLMIAYRIQYEPFNREARRVVREGTLGRIKLIEGTNGQNQGDPEQWRQKRALAGGGSLPDVGLYCLNTTRFLLGEEPVEIVGTVYSTPNDPRFKEVEENCLWQMRFPSGAQANLMTGYGHHRSSRYRVIGERGWANMDAAFPYEGQRLEIAHAEGTSERVENRRVPVKNHFAAEIDHMSDCVLNNKPVFTPGEEGLQDHLLMEAIYESARTGRPVKLPPVEKRDAFRGPEPADS